MSSYKIRPSPSARGGCSLLSDNRGMAAVEFALVLPVMLTIMFGMATLTEQLLAVHKIELAANSVADIVSTIDKGSSNFGQGAITSSDIDDAFKAARFLTSPLPVANLHVDIYEIELSYANMSGSGATRAANYQAKVVWKASDNGTQELSCGSQLSAGDDGPNSLPAVYLQTPSNTAGGVEANKGRYIIVTHVQYEWTSPFGIGLFNWARTRSSTIFRAGHAQNRNMFIPEHILNQSGGRATTCTGMISP
jgi:Flp pilus assembly protein TadG